MHQAGDRLESEPRSAAKFDTTHWSVVVRAGGNQAQNSEAGIALQTLCRNYWFPLYAYVRRRGYARADAEDLTQSFFAKLLEKGDVGRATPQRGRFRTFLLASLRNFLIDEWDKNRTQKRGSGVELLPLDFENGEERLAGTDY